MEEPKNNEFFKKIFNDILINFYPLSYSLQIIKEPTGFFKFVLSDDTNSEPPSLRLCERFANEKDQNTLILLASMYFLGKNVKANTETFFEYLNKAKDISDNPITKYFFAIPSIQGLGNLGSKGGITLLEECAEANNEKAQLLLGLYALIGFYQKRDSKKAMEWYERAHRTVLRVGTEARALLERQPSNVWYQGVYTNFVKKAEYNAENIHNLVLGMSYERGFTTYQDERLAFYYYALASEAGIDEARFAMAEMLFAGKGPFAEPNLALSVYKNLDEQGLNPMAAYRLGEWYSKNKSETKAIEYFEKAKKQGFFWNANASNDDQEKKPHEEQSVNSAVVESSAPSREDRVTPPPTQEPVHDLILPPYTQEPVHDRVLPPQAKEPTTHDASPTMSSDQEPEVLRQMQAISQKVQQDTYYTNAIKTFFGISYVNLTKKQQVMLDSPEKALTMLRKSEGMGNVCASVYLAAMYREGYGVEKNIQRAKQHAAKASGVRIDISDFLPDRWDTQGMSRSEAFEQAVANGDAQAQRVKGILAILGIGMPKAFDDGVLLLKKASATDKIAHVRLAELAIEKKIARTESEIMKDLEIGTQIDHPVAIYLTVLLHIENRSRTLSQADLFLLQKAVLAGYSKAVHLEGSWYYESNSRKKVLEGIRIWKEGYDNGNPWCGLSYSICLLRGYGVREDRREGLDILQNLADSGFIDAQMSLAHYYLNAELSSEEEIKKGIAYLEMCAEAGEVNAQVEIGEIYGQGSYHTPVDKERSIAWLDKAMKTPSGTLYAAGLKAKFTYSKKGVQGVFSPLLAHYLSLTDNFMLYSDVMERAERGRSKAQWVIGMYAMIGENDPEKAFLWFSKAAEQGLFEAQYILISMYEFGIGTPKNPAKVRSILQSFFKERVAVPEFIFNELLSDSLTTRSIEMLFKSIGWRAQLFYKDRNTDTLFRDVFKFRDNNIECIVGAVFLTGLTRSQNLAKSLEWFKRSANHGNVHAALFVSNFYRRGIGTFVDEQMSDAYLKLAATLLFQNTFPVTG